MFKFGVIAEGPSDQAVIENILIGYFKCDGEEPVVNPVQPLPEPPGAPGGWTLVFQSLKDGEPQKALQFNDYLVIHIDTDVQEEPGFDVSRRDGGNELSVADRVARVIKRLIADMDTANYAANADRILFAIAVDSIECWLLPLLYDDSRAEKITGCLEAANRELRRKKMNGLSAGDTKFPPAYDQASRDYTKRNKLMHHCDKNPSLQLFVRQLDALQNSLAGKLPAPQQDVGNAAPEECRTCFAAGSEV